MNVIVEATDPRPGAPLLKHGRWTLHIGVPGTFPRRPDGPRVRIDRPPPRPASVRRLTPAELETVVDHVIGIRGYGEKGLTIENRSFIRALLDGAWWIRQDVEKAIDQLRVLSARAVG